MGLLTPKGKFIINPQFDSAQSFSEGLAAVKSGDKYGYINTKGKYVINPQFDDANYFREGLARVRLSKQYGYINTKGEYVVNPQFGSADNFCMDGYAIIATKDKKYDIIDKSGASLGFAFQKMGYHRFGICIASGCYNEFPLWDNHTHCYEHQTKSTSSSSSGRYCQAYGCYNKVYSSYQKYCSKHSYLE